LGAKRITSRGAPNAGQAEKREGGPIVEKRDGGGRGRFKLGNPTARKQTRQLKARRLREKKIVLGQPAKKGDRKEQEKKGKGACGWIKVLPHIGGLHSRHSPVMKGGVDWGARGGGRRPGGLEGFPLGEHAVREDGLRQKARKSEQAAP